MRLIIFEGVRGGKFYWRFVAGNNRTIATGAEPFSSASNAKRAFMTAKSQITRFGFYGIVKLKARKRRQRRRAR